MDAGACMGGSGGGAGGAGGAGGGFGVGGGSGLFTCDIVVGMPCASGCCVADITTFTFSCVNAGDMCTNLNTFMSGTCTNGMCQ
jgi:hypothetical protein